MCDTVWYDIAVELIYRCVILDKPITRVSNNKLWSLHDDHIMVVFCEYILQNAIYCAWKNFYEDGKSCESYKWQNSENNELINIGPHATNLMKDVMDKKIFKIDKSALHIFLCCSRDFDTLQDIFSVSPGLWNKIDQIDPECILYFEIKIIVAAENWTFLPQEVCFPIIDKEMITGLARGGSWGSKSRQFDTFRN